jgi:hypothetical protein
VREELDYLITAETYKKAYIMLYLVPIDGNVGGIPSVTDLNYLDLSESYNSEFYYMGV